MRIATGSVPVLVATILFCLNLGTEARHSLPEDGGIESLNAKNILDQFKEMLPANARKVLEVKAAPARRRLLATAALTQAQQCEASFGTKGKATVVLVADAGTFTGVAEGTFYEFNLKKSKVINATLCLSRSYGKLAGVNVVLAATGIGPTAAAICLSEILLCAHQVKEILYSGTAGWTPQVGGLLDTEDCSRAQPARKITRLGDVCVSPYSMNFNCKLADYAAQVVGAPNLCALPLEDVGPSASYLYGDCVFATPDKKSVALTKRVFAAVTSAKAKLAMPKRTKKVSDYESAYWALAKKTMNRSYKYSATKTATVWSSDICMEVDSQFFYSGSPFDQVSRQYISDSLSGNVTNGYIGGIGKKVSRHEVIVVSAMEAVGVMELMSKFNALKHDTYKIGYVMIRGNSDYDTKPMAHHNGVWTYPPGIPTADFTSGYAYAIATTSFTMLTYLKSQCKSNCGFLLPYPQAVTGA